MCRYIGSGEMTQMIRILASLPEDLRLDLRSHVGPFIPAHTSSTSEVHNTHFWERLSKG